MSAAGSTTGYVITLAVLLLIGAGVIVLQVFLSRSESKWPGLILPAIAFCFSLIAVMSMVLFSVSTHEVLSENGVIIEERVATPLMDIPSMIATTGSTLLLFNIPTAVLLAIYAACRGKRNRQRALERMSVQDLE